MYAHDIVMSREGCGLHLGPPFPSITMTRDLGDGLGSSRSCGLPEGCWWCPKGRVLPRTLPALPSGWEEIERLTWAITSLRMFHCLTLPKNDSQSPVEIRPLYNNFPPHICFSFVAVIKNCNYLPAFFFRHFKKWKFMNNYKREQNSTWPSCTHHPASTIANSGSVFFHLYLHSLPPPVLIWGIISFHL